MVNNYHCESWNQTEVGIANATSKCGEDPNCAMVSTLNCNDEDAIYNLCEMSTELVPKLGACTRWKIGTELMFTISKKISTFKILEMRFKIYFRNNLIVPHCLDESQNEDETGIDCGGSCKPCQGMHLAMFIM